MATRPPFCFGESFRFGDSSPNPPELTEAEVRALAASVNRRYVGGMEVLDEATGERRAINNLEMFADLAARDLPPTRAELETIAARFSILNSPERRTNHD